MHSDISDILLVEIFFLLINLGVIIFYPTTILPNYFFTIKEIKINFLFLKMNAIQVFNSLKITDYLNLIE